MMAKDAAAAAVLLLAIAAVVVFADVMLHAWPVVLANTHAVVRTTLLGVPLLATTAGLLAMPRRPFGLALLGLVAIGLLSVLAVSARDAAFVACAYTFVAGAIVARVLEPKL